MASASKKQNTMVVVGALVILIVSVLVTLYATGIIFQSGSGSANGYQNVTFTDAVLTCRSQVEGNYGKRIRTLVTDNHSSRFDERSYLYKIFLKMDLYKTNSGEISEHYINCFVRASTGGVRKFEVLDVEERKESSPADGTTNMFGIPVNR